MATRSTIAFQDNTGRVHQVYCHWDGYLSNNGNILLGNYTDINLIGEMVAGGDMSSLGHVPDDCEYYKDKGEDDYVPRVFTSYDDYIEHGQYEEYNYLYKDEQWYVHCGLTDDSFELLTESLIALEG